MFEFEIAGELYQVVTLEPTHSVDAVYVLAQGVNDTNKTVSGMIRATGGVFNRGYQFRDDKDETVYTITRNVRMFYGDRLPSGSVQFARWSGSRFYAPNYITISFANGHCENHNVKSYHFHHQTDRQYFGQSNRNYQLDTNGIGLYRIETNLGNLDKLWTDDSNDDGFMRHVWHHTDSRGDLHQLKSISLFDFE